MLLSLAVAAMGVIDLLSALLSRPPERLLALRRLVPTVVLDSSRTFTLLAGLLLLVTAWGLRRGKRRAFVAAMLLCAVSVPVNLLKAFDVEEATAATALMFALGVSAAAFEVRSREPSFAGLRSRAIAATLALVVYAAAGCWALEWQFGMRPSAIGVLSDAAWRTFGVGRPVAVPAALRPPDRRIVIWYLRSLPMLGVTLLTIGAIAALRPARHRRRHRAEAARVEDLLHAYGASSIASFALADDSDYFWSRNRRAVIAYRFESDVLLAIGDPIGPPEELRDLMEEFMRFSADHDWAFGFFQARPELLPLYETEGLRALHIGEDPVLWTDRSGLDGPALASVRRAVRKAQASGITVRHFSPGHDPDLDLARSGMLEELRAVSEQWLRGRAGGEKGFCMGRFEPRRLGREWLAAAWNPTAGRVEALVTWVPIPARRGWALDLIRRRDDAAPGVTELLIVRSVEAARARGDAMLSLSLSALAMVDGESASVGEAHAGAGRAPCRAAAGPLALVPPPERTREFLTQHLARFYDFDGLFRWKRKFDPAFEDRYLIHPGPLALPRVVLALIRAQSPGGLLSYLAPRPEPRAEVPARS